MSYFLKSALLFLLCYLPLASFSLERSALLPPNAKTYVRVSNTVTFWEQLKKSSFGKLWVDQQFQDFIGNPETDIWQELLFKGESEA